MPYILVAAGACGLATLFFVSSLTMQPAAYQMPRILVVLLFVLAAAMLVDVFVQKRRHKPEASRTPEEEAAAPLLVPFFDGIRIGRVAVFLGGAVLYVMLIEPVGYFIVTPAFLLGTLLYLKACRPLSAIVIAALAPVGVFFVFKWLLDLPVPLGVMG